MQLSVQSASTRASYAGLGWNPASKSRGFSPGLQESWATIVRHRSD